MSKTTIARHTPAPWTVEPGDNGDPSVGAEPVQASIFASVPNDDRYRFVEIAIVKDPIYGNDEDGHPMYFGEREANANLIAAAPDLLAALNDVVGVYERVGGPLAVDPAVAKARAVLARAEGR